MQSSPHVRKSLYIEFGQSSNADLYAT